MTEELVKKAVCEAIDEKLGDFFIEREKHFQHHQFLDGIMTTTAKIKGTACKTITNSLIYGAIALLLLGIVAWADQHLKK